MYLTQHPFTHGQLYVALSRVSYFNQLSIYAEFRNAVRAYQDDQRPGMPQVKRVVVKNVVYTEVLNEVELEEMPGYIQSQEVDPMIAELCQELPSQIPSLTTLPPSEKIESPSQPTIMTCKDVFGILCCKQEVHIVLNIKKLVEI